ncbi:hypothetical protein RF11_14265 [Thelohanellus kitauei]|uniref:Uncharacterized protein n=1 Tax=Thelohanellus kitauei TaxID=669202 RepID=A0A0C2MEV4_THEKT|nr:hypothetical protein RF11_14265 [Thelohanellus kitauei]
MKKNPFATLRFNFETNDCYHMFSKVVETPKNHLEASSGLNKVKKVIELSKSRIESLVFEIDKLQLYASDLFEISSHQSPLGPIAHCFVDLDSINLNLCKRLIDECSRIHEVVTYLVV